MRSIRSSTSTAASSTPAFVDAHVHTTSAGLALTGLDLSRATSLGEALDLVEQTARERRGAVVLGHGWDESTWPERRPPTRSELDRASYGGVVYLSRIDVHSCVVSSALLAAVPRGRGLCTATTRTAGCGRRHTTRSGQPPSPLLPPSQAAAARRATREHAASLGIGSFHELGGPDINGLDDFAAVLQQAEQEPGPTVIGYWGALGDAGIAQAKAMGARGAAGDLFVDGAIGSRTAHLCEPYADADTRGAQYLTTEQIRDHVVSCTRAGLQAGFHVIGDAATQSVLQGFSAAAAVVGVEAIRERRHRVEHIEMPGDGIQVLADLQVHASVQPLFDAMWGGSSAMYADRLGAERAAGLNPFGVMHRAGVPLALGSDAPVTAMGPWAAIGASVNHHVPEHGLTATDAFAAHTRGGWRAAGDDRSGVIAVGAPTTLAVWSCDSFPDTGPAAVPPTCLRTIVEGQTVYSTQASIHEDVSQ